MTALFATAIAVALVIGNVYGESETLQTFDTSSRAGFQPADAVIADKDGNGVKPTVSNVTGHIAVKIETMPPWDSVDPTAIHENNYVYLPFVSNPTDNEMVHVRYTYRQTAPCPQYTRQPVQCKSYVMMYLVKVASSLTHMSGMDIPANSIKAFNLSAPSETDVQSYVTILPRTAGFRLVIHDEGSSFDIHTVSLTRYFCRLGTATNNLPITCPDTPATDARDVSTQCRCGDVNSKPISGRMTIDYSCKFSQAYDHASYTVAPIDNGTYCACDPGYTYTNVLNGQKYCKVSVTSKPPGSATSPPIISKAAAGSSAATGSSAAPTQPASSHGTTDGCTQLANSWLFAVVCFCGLAMLIHP